MDSPWVKIWTMISEPDVVIEQELLTQKMQNKFCNSFFF